MSGDAGHRANRADSGPKLLRSEWALRQSELGNLPQAVLLRNLSPEINEVIDAWHRDLLRWALAPLARTPGCWVADLGCGYGRLANEIATLGPHNVIGLDSESGFCRQYQADYGLAVRGSVDAPPFCSDVLSAAYSVTALMYVGKEGARTGLQRLSPSLKRGARILLLEAGAEFNGISRFVLRGKRTQALSVRGFSQHDLCSIVPAEWKILATGANAGLSFLLPLLICLRRWSRGFTWVSNLARWIDRPADGLRDRGWRRVGLHRWVLCETPGADPGRVTPATSIAAICNPETPNTPPLT